MPRQKPLIATLNDVEIKREGTAVSFKYINQGDRGGQRIEVGKDTGNMTDLELLDIHNHIATKMIESSENYEHIAFETPEGKPRQNRKDKGEGRQVNIKLRGAREMRRCHE